MIYHLHDVWRHGLRSYFNAVAAATGVNAQIVRSSAPFSPLPGAVRDMARTMEASAAMMERATRDYPKPAFNLPETKIGGRTVPVREETVSERPYCSLKHFARATDRKDPKVLIVAPMSGHYATLLRGTVEAMLPHNDVYITDWKDARDVPLRDGSFGLEDYITYVRDMIRELGPDVHVVAVCQPTVPVMAAVSVMAAENDPAQPLSMTLMGGPIDTRANATAVTKYGESKPIEWFRDNVTMTVPPWYSGAGQRVYPGFMQLMGFMSMNPDKHYNSHADLFRHLCSGQEGEADKIRDFYDEYLAVCDLPAAFYLDTVELVFQKQALARGTLTYKGRPVDPSRIARTAVLTVEGALDDIAAPGQTLAAHGLLAGLSRSRKYHYVQEGAGHYGIFNGRRWREEISPRLESFIRQAASENGTFYDPLPVVPGAKNEIKKPPLWDGQIPLNFIENKYKYTNDNSPKKSNDQGKRLG